MRRSKLSSKKVSGSILFLSWGDALASFTYTPSSQTCGDLRYLLLPPPPFPLSVSRFRKRTRRVSTGCLLEKETSALGDVFSCLCPFFQVYAGFFVLSAIYLLVHSRRRSSRGTGPESFPMQSMAEAGESEDKPDFAGPPEPLPATLTSKKLSLTRTAPDSRGDE